MKTAASKRSASPQSSAAQRAYAEELRHSAIVDVKNRPVVPARRYSVQAVEDFLDRMADRQEHRNAFGLKETVKQWVANAKEAIHTVDWLKSKGEVAMAAARGDAEAMEMHAAAIEITTTNVITASTTWASFFQMESLAEADYAVINSDVHGMAITVDTIGQDGGRQTIQAQTTNPGPVVVPIHLRTTPWIEYPLFDLYKGSSVKDLALAQFDLARDRAYRLDALLGSYLLADGTNTRLVASFVTNDALDGNNDYFAHPNVKTGNLPAGNLITLSGNSPTSLFRKEVFDAIITYCRSWGDNVLDSGSFMPVEIIIASSHVTHFLSQVTLTNTPNFLVDQVFEGGMVLSYGGYKWVISGINTISPTDGVAYVRMSQPIGIMYDKPAAAQTIQDDSKTLLSQNLGRVCETWAESFAMPRHWRKRMLGVRYRTAS
jgi:hypothetical protein